VLKTLEGIRDEFNKAEAGARRSRSPI